MSRGQRVAEAIERAVSGPTWHGSALAELLIDVTPSQAAARPIEGAHTIWELVLHVTAWTEIARERLIGSAKSDPTPEEDWPPVRDTSAEAWRSTVERLKEARSEEHTSELQSQSNLVCRLLLEKKKRQSEQ